MTRITAFTSPPLGHGPAAGDRRNSDGSRVRRARNGQAASATVPDNTAPPVVGGDLKVGSR